MEQPRRQTRQLSDPRLPASGLVEALQGRIAAIEGARRESGGGRLASVSSGCEALDRLLPGPGFRRGTLVEWLSADAGSGAGTLALCVARQACEQGQAIVILEPQGTFYPPAAVRLGIEPEKLIVVQCPQESEGAWALDQSLRCPAVAAAVAWPAALGGHAFRRLQLAAEEGGSLGLLIRPSSARHEPSWADVRLEVRPLSAAGVEVPRRLNICVLRSRGTVAGRSIQVEIDDETRIVHLDSRVADPTARGRAAGA